MMIQHEIDLLKSNMFAALKIQGLMIVVGVVAMLAGWVWAAQQFSLDVVFASRCAILACVPILLFGIFYPLLADVPDKKRVFVLCWFVVATFFNLWWQVPQVLLMDIFREANLAPSLEKLPYFVAWWGYSTSDLDYFTTNRYFVLAEISFWVINLLSFLAIHHMLKGREMKAMLWFLICAALQIYNVMCMFLPHGIIVEQWGNVATDSPLAPAIFWVMNLMWVVAASFAAVFSYQRILESRGDSEEQEGAYGRVGQV